MANRAIMNKTTTKGEGLSPFAHRFIFILIFKLKGLKFRYNLKVSILCFFCIDTPKMWFAPLWGLFIIPFCYKSKKYAK